MNFADLVFYAFAAIAVVAALLMITRRSPVYSAMYLVLTLFSLAAIFVLLDAHFLAALQVVVYAGAILVLFLFVIMLLNLGHDFEPDLKGRFALVLAGGVGLVLLAELFTTLRRHDPGPQIDILSPLLAARGAVGAVAEPLFRDYLVAVEITGVLLLVAMVGAVVIARGRA